MMKYNKIKKLRFKNRTNIIYIIKNKFKVIYFYIFEFFLKLLIAYFFLRSQFSIRSQ